MAILGQGTVAGALGISEEELRQSLSRVREQILLLEPFAVAHVIINDGSYVFRVNACEWLIDWENAFTSIPVLLARLYPSKLDDVKRDSFIDPEQAGCAKLNIRIVSSPAELAGLLFAEEVRPRYQAWIKRAQRRPAWHPEDTIPAFRINTRRCEQDGSGERWLTVSFRLESSDSDL